MKERVGRGGVNVFVVVDVGLPFANRPSPNTLVVSYYSFVHENGVFPSFFEVCYLKLIMVL